MALPVVSVYIDLVLSGRALGEEANCGDCARHFPIAGGHAGLKGLHFPELRNYIISQCIRTEDIGSGRKTGPDLTPIDGISVCVGTIGVIDKGGGGGRDRMMRFFSF